MLGIDIGANKVLAFVADLAGDVVAVERRRTGQRSAADADALLALVEDGGRRARSRRREVVAGRRCTAVGVGTPGVVDPVSGRVTLAPQLGGWEGIRLAEPA